jgi:hypothetical protein
MRPSSIVITIAGMTVEFVFANAQILARVRKRYHGWIVSGKRALLRFTCVPAKSFGSGVGSGMPCIHAASIAAGRITRGDFDCRWSAGVGIIRMRPSIYAFDACLRVLLCTLMPLRGGLLLHASALIASGKRGFVFAGRSGSGKTTIARMLARNRILNDEICAVNIDKTGAVRVSGTPFWGEMRTGPACQEAYRLSTLYFLKKAPVTAREIVERREVVRRLLACICHFSKGAGHTGVVLDLALRFAQRVNVFELCFRRSADEVATVSLGPGEPHDS